MYNGAWLQSVIINSITHKNVSPLIQYGARISKGTSEEYSTKLLGTKEFGSVMYCVMGGSGNETTLSSA